MYSDSPSKRLFLLTITALIISTGSVGALNIDILGAPSNSNTVSNDTSTVRVVNITDNGEMMNQSDIGNDFLINFTYNASNGTTYDLEHLSQGYWYADFRFNDSEGRYVNYSIEEKSGTQDRANTREKLTTGSLKLELMKDMSKRLSPGEDISLRVNVTDLSQQEPETNADVQAYFTNGSNTINLQGLNNQDGSEYYNSEISTPSNYGGNYILRINSSESSDTGQGSLAIPVKMEPPMTGDITSLESASGCDSTSFFTECERGAEITTGYNVTGSVPSSVNLSVKKQNSSSGEWQTHEEIEMKNNSVYEATTTVPDLNTSEYNREIRFVYNASNDRANAVETYNITVRDYRIRFGASSSTQQGGSYNLELAFEKYFSSQALDRDRMNADINITNSSQTLLQYDLSDMDYSDGVFQLDVPIGSDWKEGTYNIEVNATDIFYNSKQAQDSFYVEEVDRTFNVTEDVNGEVVTKGIYEFNMTLNNLQSSELNLTATPGEDLENFTSVNGSIVIPADSEVEKPVQFNLSGMSLEQDIEGHITVEDSGGFNDTVEVDLEVPGCDYRSGSYCLSGELNNSRDSRGYALNQVDLYFIADENESATITPSADGNVSEILSFTPAEFEVNSSNSRQSLVLNYSATSPGYFTGTLSIGEASAPVSFNSNVVATELSISTPGSIDLGTLPEDESVRQELDIENTGDVTITGLSFEAESMEVSGESVEIAPGETETVDLGISGIQGSGSITVTAESASQTTDAVIDVSVETIPDLSERAGELRDRVNELQTQVTSTENQNTLNTATFNITEIQNAYRAGDYEEAQEMYEATQNSIERVSSSVSSTSSDGSQSTGSQNSTGSVSEPSGTTSSSGDAATFIIIGVVVFILLIAGFVLYTSYIPEEGDPLYGVLGK